MCWTFGCLLTATFPKYFFADANYVLKRRAIELLGTENATVACLGALKKLNTAFALLKDCRNKYKEESRLFKSFGVNLSQEERQEAEKLGSFGIVVIRKCVEIYGSLGEQLFVCKQK